MVLGDPRGSPGWKRSPVCPLRRGPSAPLSLQMECLFGSLPEMLQFQKVFLETLEAGVSAASDFDVLETPSQFRVSGRSSHRAGGGGMDREGWWLGGVSSSPWP